MSAEIVVGAELNCWPDKDLAPKLESCLPRPGAWPGESKDKAIYRYPNTGTMIGMADSVKRVVRQAFDKEVSSVKPSDKPDDQHAIQRQIIRDAKGWRLDREAYLFQTLAGGAEAHLEHDNGVPRNRITTCRPAFLHANGYGAKAADVLDRVGPRACPPMADLAEDAGEWQVLGQDIVGMPFLAPRSARALAEAAHAAPGWQPLPGDNVPGDELRVKSFDAGRAAQIEEGVNKHLASMVGSFWRPARWPGAGRPVLHPVCARPAAVASPARGQLLCLVLDQAPGGLRRRGPVVPAAELHGRKYSGGMADRVAVEDHASPSSDARQQRAAHEHRSVEPLTCRSNGPLKQPARAVRRVLSRLTISRRR